MCGRYVVVSKIQEIQEELNAVVKFPNLYAPSPNVSAGDTAFALFRKNVLYPVQFGFSPSWSEKRHFVINARYEGDRNKENRSDYKGYPGIYDKPFFKHAIRKHRCVIPMNAFIEGPTDVRLKKPYVVFNPSQRFLYAAGIYSILSTDAEPNIVSMAILTKGPSPICDKIKHHRSPVLLDKELVNNYLDKNLTQMELSQILQNSDDTSLNAYPINSDIRNPASKDFDVLKPIGDLVIPSSKFKVEQHFELQGMGQTRGRQNKLFE